ncbi:hypothetical protein QTA57_17985 [Fontisubflavum oceani]|uniref:hypothetical protein n=1 Tax=Fontisubflavum oceani TaxID=2978973 RepID=UPI0025B2BA6F|nr:hypothetical protein [Fontisubflavum oceani]WJY21590.1 hypothetical protein QTA57_17985 [Fontisubflavum oceani]
MADDDEGAKENTDRKHKPNHVADKERAPRGSLGNAVIAPTLGFHGSSGYTKIDVTVYIEDDSQREPELSPEEQRKAYLEGLPDDTVFAVETGDEAVDAESMKRGEVLITEQEKAALKALKENLEQGQVSASDFAKAFKRASDRTSEIKQDRSQEPDL